MGGARSYAGEFCKVRARVVLAASQRCTEERKDAPRWRAALSPLAPQSNNQPLRRCEEASHCSRRPGWLEDVGDPE